MTTNRLLIALVALIAALQASDLITRYRFRGRTTARERLKDAPPGTVVRLANLPLKGDSEVVLIEFSDYECPYCARHAAGVQKELQKEFVSKGKLSYAFANNPLPMHSNAKLLAKGAICAGEQGRYWEMHDVLFESKPQDERSIVSASTSVDLDRAKFQACLKDSPFAVTRISEDIETAQRLQLSSTPSFALGHRTANGTVIVKKLIIGAQKIDVFAEAINALLDERL